MRMVERFLSGRRQLYATPTSEQLDACWKEVCRALAEPVAAGVFKKNETLHQIELPGTEQRLRGKTAWNADTMRGDYADDLYLDEWQLMDDEVWEVVAQPMLLDKNGDAVLIYTPPSIRTRSQSRARDPLHAAKMFKAKQLEIAEDIASGREPTWAVFHFPSWANPYISKQALDDISRDMSALAVRQEIAAEDIMEVPGALWTRELIDKTRVKKEALPEMRRIVVAIDPSVTSKETSDECGLVVCGEGIDGQGYVLADLTRRDTPLGWSRRAVAAYHEWKADRVIAEVNNGGDLVELTIRSLPSGDYVSYKAVSASRGKLVRAEPVVARFEREIMHIVGVMPELEDELVSYVPGDSSPNRLDALVWGMTELFEHSTSSSVADYYKLEQAKLDDAKEKIMETAKIAGSSLTKPLINDKTDVCPKCGSKAIAKMGRGWRCQHCGQQWGPIFQAPAAGQSRRDLFK